MAGQLVNVAKAFTLSIVRDGQFVKQRIEAGLQELEQDIVEHWYTQAHVDASGPVAAPVADAGKGSKGKGSKG